MDRIGGHYINWPSLDTEQQIPYAFSHMTVRKVDLNVK